MKKTISTQKLIKALKSEYQDKKEIENYYIKEGRKEEAKRVKNERFIIWRLASEILDLPIDETWDLLEGVNK